MNHLRIRALEDLRANILPNPQTTNNLRACANGLASATSFVLPMDGWALGDEQDAWDLWREMNSNGMPVRALPFPITCLEFPVSRVRGVSHRIVVACSGSEWQKLEESFGVEKPMNLDASSIVAFTFCYVTAFKYWKPWPHAVIFHATSNVWKSGDGSDTAVVHFPICESVQFGLTDEVVQRDMHLEVDAMLTPVFELICSMACRNVSAVRVDPDTALNVARERRDKLPFAAYYTLMLKDHDPDTGAGLGTKASPAMHLRRGHIRRLRLGGYTFVRAHVVGKPKDGLISKAYAVPSMAVRKSQLH